MKLQFKRYGHYTIEKYEDGHFYIVSKSSIMKVDTCSPLGIKIHKLQSLPYSASFIELHRMISVLKDAINNNEKIEVVDQTTEILSQLVLNFKDETNMDVQLMAYEKTYLFLLELKKKKMGNVTPSVSSLSPRYSYVYQITFGLKNEGSTQECTNVRDGLLHLLKNEVDPNIWLEPNFNYIDAISIKML